MKRTYRAMLQPGQPVDDLFLIVDLAERVGRSGDLYLVLTLGDRTGQLRAYVGRPAGPLMVGEVVRVRGRTRQARGELEIVVSSIQAADPLSYHLSDFTPTAPESRLTYLNRLSDLVDEIADPGYRTLVLTFLEDAGFLERFCRAPASLSYHHAYEGGLLQHTVEIMEAALWLAPTFAERLDLNLLLTAAFCHDLGKIEAYTEHYPYELTPLGRLAGHEILGLGLLFQAMERQPDLSPLARGRLLATLAGAYRWFTGNGRPRGTLEGAVMAALDGLSVGFFRAQSLTTGTPRPAAGTHGHNGIVPLIHPGRPETGRPDPRSLPDGAHGCSTTGRRYQPLNPSSLLPSPGRRSGDGGPQLPGTRT